MKDQDFTAAQWRAIAREADELAVMLDHEHHYPWFETQHDDTRYSLRYRLGTKLYGVLLTDLAGLDPSDWRDHLRDYDRRHGLTPGGGVPLSHPDDDSDESPGLDRLERAMIRLDEASKASSTRGRQANADAAKKMLQLYQRATAMANTMPESEERARARNGSWIALAIAMHERDPSISDGQIAGLLGIARSTVRRNKRWQEYRRTASRPAVRRASSAQAYDSDLRMLQF